MKIKKNLKAFTLAEVLIALTVIGVIAAITVPALIQRTQKQEYVSALQKAYSTLSQAANMIIAENGSPKCNDGGWACSNREVYDLFKKYLNNTKECREVKGGCVPQGSYKFLGSSYIWLDADNYPVFVMSDGIQVMFEGADKNCSFSRDSDNSVCAYLAVDINGAKQPNRVGRDVFRLVVKETGLYPNGCPSENCPNAWGLDCACKVIREGAMNY